VPKQESTLYVQESALYVQESALYIKEDSEQALEEMAAPEPALYRKRCPQCGSVEFELLVRDGRRVEVCENCGQPFQAEDR
jgi:rRNA maturation endonuclease Nob1